MKRSPLVRAGASLVGVLLILSVAQSAKADTFIGGTNVWTMVGPPSFPATNINRVGAVTYMDNLNVTFTGIVIMVVRDNLNQTVYYSTATMSPPSGASATAELVLFGLPPATYSATFFAFTFSGVAISTSATVPLTIS